MPEIYVPGSVCRLKSGGPSMTVVMFNNRECHPGSPSGYLCMWFDHEKKLHRDWFEEAVLDFITPIRTSTLRAPNDPGEWKDY